MTEPIDPAAPQQPVVPVPQQSPASSYTMPDLTDLAAAEQQQPADDPDGLEPEPGWIALLALGAAARSVRSGIVYDDAGFCCGTGTTGCCGAAGSMGCVMTTPRLLDGSWTVGMA